MVAVIVGLLAGGPVGRFKVAAEPRRRVARGDGNDPALPQYSRGSPGSSPAPPWPILLVLQKGETRHWRKQSAGFEQLYRQSRPRLPSTVANYRAAADGARRRPANARRVAAAQDAINERTAHDFETRLADARAAAGRLRVEPPAPQPIPVLAEQRRCPAYPLPPAALLKPPVKTDFLPPTR